MGVMKMGYIYKITNDKNGKMYIGKTELPKVETRWKEHLRDYNKEQYKKKPLYKAMKKYGVEHFHFEVIEEIQSSKELCEREQYWINELRTYTGFDDCNGYNATLGGDGVCYLELDEQEVINYHTNEAAYVMGRTAKYFNVSYRSIKKILIKNNIPWVKNKELNLLKSYEELGGVLQVSLKNKIVENIFESLVSANIYMGKSEHNPKICRACNGENNGSHYAYGYLWYYGKDLPKIKDELKFIY